MAEAFLRRRPEVCLAVGHAEETIPAIEPTCTESGITEGKICEICNKTLVEQSVLNPLGHDYGDWESNSGNTHAHTCSVCSYVEEESCTYESTASSYDQYYHYYSCDKCNNSSSEGHSKRYVSGSEPNCTEWGSSGYQYCTKCDYNTGPSIGLPPLGHDVVIVDETEPTCTTDGNWGYEYCQRPGCDYRSVEEGEEVRKALGHAWSTTYVPVPEMSHIGHVRMCTRSGCTAYSNAEDHKYDVTWDGTWARHTCTICEEGYGSSDTYGTSIDDQYHTRKCSDCDAILVSRETHSYSRIGTSADAECTLCKHQCTHSGQTFVEGQYDTCKYCGLRQA